MPEVTATLHTFIDVEERAGLWDLEAFGQRYWHQIRFQVYGEVLRALGLVDKAQRSWRDRTVSSWLSNVRPPHWPHAIRRSLWHDMDRADVLFVNHPRHVRVGHHWVCPYTQPLLEGFAPSYWVMEDVWQGVHSFPQPDYRLKYLEWPILNAQIAFLARSGLSGGRLSAREREVVGEWRAELERALGGAPTREKAVAMVRAAVREVAALRDVYRRLLDRVQPKLVVMVVHYSYRCLPLTAAARERGIPVAELQHGTLGPGNPAYNVARDRRPTSFPDYLLTWGDFWRDTTPLLPLASRDAPAIGYAWLERHLSNRSARQPPRERPVVLFVSQGTIGAPLSRMAVDLAKRGSATVRYKLHPGELLGWRERYPWLSASGIEVIDVASDIYDEFERADVAVGGYSTAMIEAVAFGLPVLVAELYGLEHMRALLDLGCARTVGDVDTLDRAIRDCEPPPASKRERLWKSDPIANFRRFVERTIA